MRKSCILFLTLLFLSGNFNQVFAQTPIEATETIEDPQYLDDITVSSLIEPARPTSDMIMPPYQPAIYHFGQDHRYSVLLRGNGEAVVYFRGAFTNETDDPINKIDLGVQDGVNLKQLSAYQIMKKPYCANYGANNECLNYSDPDYYEPYAYGGVSEYYKSDTNLTDESLTVELVEPILSGNQGAYLLFYRADGITEESFAGGYDYDFETFKVDDNLKSVSVGIEGDPEWKFKGADVAIGYMSTSRQSLDSLATIEKSSPDARNASFDSLVSNIGYGMITKTSSGLAPLENMVVEGTYAKNYFGLYYKEIGIVATILLIFLAIVALLVFKLYRNSNKPSDGSSSSKPTDNLKIMMAISNLLIPTMAVMFTVGIIAFLQMMSSIAYYNSSTLPLMIVVVMVSLLFFFSVFVGSAVYFGVKKGVGWGLANMFINLFIYLALMSIVIGVMYVFMSGSNQIIPFESEVRLMDAPEAM